MRHDVRTTIIIIITRRNAVHCAGERDLDRM